MGLPNVVKGVLSNGIAGAILYAVATTLSLEKYVLTAVGMQYFVFAVHGLPQNSERSSAGVSSRTCFAFLKAMMPRYILISSSSESSCGS